MEKENQNKWESWASQLHEGEKATGISDADKKDFEAVQNIFQKRNQVQKALSFTSADLAWDKLKAQIVPQTSRFGILKYAAVIMISVLITSAVFWITGNVGLNEYATITAPKGQISNITLFDGTNVWLNAGSSLKYKQSFNKNNRDIILDGEALFSVTKNKNLPFIVNAGDAKVKVFGTEFNVKAYANESFIETVLVEGKVQFSAGDKEVMMKPGEFLSISKNNLKIQTKEVNAENYTSWKGGTIFYDNEILLNIVRQIERWYNVNFSFNDDQIKSYRFTGVIDKSKSLQNTLSLIKGINKVDIFKNGEIYIITDKDK